MKRLIIIVLILIAIGTTVFFVARKYLESPDLSRQLNERLVQLVAEKSNGLYRLTIGQISIDAGNTSALLKDIRLNADSVLLLQLQENQVSPTVIYDFTLDHLIIKNVDILSFLNENAAKLNTITISGGKLSIRHIKKKEGKPVVSVSPKQDVVKSVKRSLREVRIDTVQINDVDIVYVNLKKQEQHLKKLHIDLYSLAIDSAAAKDSTRILFAREMKVSIDSLSLPVAENKYRLAANKIVMTLGIKSITTIRQLRFSPAAGNNLEAIAAKTGKQQDVYQLTVANTIIDNFDYIAFLEDSMIQARAVVLKDPVLQVFNDKSQKPLTESKVGKYPHQLLAKLSYGVNIPELIVENGTVNYFEKNEKGEGIGKINFEKIKGKAGPLATSKNKSSPVKAEFSAMFMNRTGMNVIFHFPVSSNGSFTVTARFNPFDVQQLNQAALPLGNMKLKEGKVTRLNFTIRGNNASATGTTTLNYEGLKVEVMKADTDDGYKKAGLLTLLANKFVLRKDNNPGDKYPDSYTTSYKRVVTKSFLNLVWKTVFYGVKANTGVGLKGSDKERATIH